MSRDEQRQAEQLYTFLRALQTGTEFTAAELGDDEIELTGALVELAKSAQPDPAFASELERRLSQSVAAGRTSAPSSFLHNLISPVTNRRQMLFKRMALALTSAVLLALLIFVALPLLSSQPKLSP